MLGKRKTPEKNETTARRHEEAETYRPIGRPLRLVETLADGNRRGKSSNLRQLDAELRQAKAEPLQLRSDLLQRRGEPLQPDLKLSQPDPEPACPGPSRDSSSLSCYKRGTFRDNSAGFRYNFSPGYRRSHLRRSVIRRSRNIEPWTAFRWTAS